MNEILIDSDNTETRANCLQVAKEMAVAFAEIRPNYGVDNLIADTAKLAYYVQYGLAGKPTV